MALSTKWLQHIEAWQQSGLPQTTYCQQKAINVRTFSARLCEYRKTQAAEPQALIPVRMAHSVSEAIILRHVKGHQVNLPMSLSAVWLAELLRCLD
jgi:hypothetical protein